MTNRRLFIAVLIALLALVAVPVWAQDAAPTLTQTYTSDNGTTTFMYPDGWDGDGSTVPAPDGSGDLEIAFIVSTESAAGKIGFPPGTVLNEGEVIVGMSVGPLAAVFGVEEGATAFDILKAAIDRSGETYSVPVEFTVNGYPAARATRRAEGFDEVDIAVYRGNGVYSFTAMFAPTDTLPQWAVTALAMTETITDSRGAESPDGLAPAAPDPTTVQLDQRFNLPDDLVIFAYPDGWSADATAVPSGDQQAVIGYIANSSAVAQQIARGPDAVLAPGQVGITFLIGPLAASFELEPTATAHEIAEASVERAGYEDFQIADSERFDFPAALIRRTLPRAEALDVVLEYGNGLFSLVTLYVPSGELEQWGPLVRTFIESLDYNAPGVFAPVALAQSFEAESGLFAAQYPDAWGARPAGDTSVYFGNSDAGLNYDFGSAMPEGSAQILVSITRKADLLLPLNLRRDSPPAAFLRGAIDVSTATGVNFGDAEDLPVNNRPAARLYFEGQGFEGFAMVIDLNADWIAAVQVVAAPDELAALEPAALSVAHSVTLAGS